MRPNPRLVIGLALGGLLVPAAGVAFAHPRAVAPGGARGTGKNEFTISGNVGGLYPGETLPLTLTVTNLRSVGIQVTSIKTTVAAASSACPAKLLQVSDFSGSLPLAANGTATTTVQASLSHGAPDACKGALFPLSYNGKGQ